MKGDILKGHLDLLVLAAVHSGPSHGYAVIQELKRKSRGEFDIPEGTIYPALHRLEADGLLSSRWEVRGPNRRRVYQLTQKGRLALGEQSKMWKRFTTAVQGVLDTR